MSWLFQHKIMALVIIVALGAVIWYFMAGSSAPSSAVLTSETGTSTESAVPGADQLITNLAALQNVNLNASIFTSPAFLSLKDITTPITPEPVGRADPFAPIGASSGAAQTTTASGAGQ